MQGMWYVENLQIFEVGVQTNNFDYGVYCHYSFFPCAARGFVLCTVRVCVLGVLPRAMRVRLSEQSLPTVCWTSVMQGLWLGQEYNQSVAIDYWCRVFQAVTKHITGHMPRKPASDKLHGFYSLSCFWLIVNLVASVVVALGTRMWFHERERHAIRHHMHSFIHSLSCLLRSSKPLEDRK
jgi:hypothetical protein